VHYVSAQHGLCKEPGTTSVCLPSQLYLAALLGLPTRQNQLDHSDHSGWYELDDMFDTVFTRMNIGGRRLILSVKFQVRPMTRCIVIVKAGPLLMKMQCQRGTAFTLFTALVTNYDLPLYRALPSADPSFSCLVCHNAHITAVFRLVICTKLASGT
jgi:hypothetical protein